MKLLVAPVPHPDPQELKELEILHALRGWVLRFLLLLLLLLLS